MLGEEHPDVATSLNNLTGVYAKQGRTSEAEPLYLQAVDIAYQQLGESHPNTQTFLNNFADCLHGVMQLARRVLSRRPARLQNRA